MKALFHYLFDQIKCLECASWVSTKEWKLWGGMCEKCYNRKRDGEKDEKT